MLAQGGGNGLEPAVFEDRVAFLGARFWSRPVSTGAVVGIELLSKDLEEGLELLFGQLKAPAFDETRLQLWRDQTLADLRQRNDDTRRLESLEWNRLLYSPDSGEGRVITAADVQAVTPGALREWHTRFVGPAGISFRVSGDVDRATLKTALESHLQGWAPATDPVPPRLPRYAGAPSGVYLLDKSVNQTRVRLALPGLERDDPRWLAGEVLNTILGGGFTSRLVQRIRSDEGLAYSVGSRLEDRHHGRGLFSGGMQTKAPSTLYAMSLYQQELRRLAEGDLQQEELDRVRQGLIEEFSGQFNTPAAIVAALHDEELSGRLSRDPRWFQDYRSRLAAVDRQAVIDLARELFTGTQPVWLLIGDAGAIEAGDGQHPLRLEDFGPVTRLPLRDPLSQQPLP
jgi:zinc protease